MPTHQLRQARNFRCAIYTRKSTTAGLDMPVTSLESQREVCQAYIKCRAHRQWAEVSQRYDDGGFSGGSLERPALKRLIADIEAGLIDIVVIYKIDRLSRSLTDFVRLMEILEKYGASFVSVTQTFDTSDSMGRLILNILLTFAQFERELMSERVKDKKAAMRRKGLFVGGTPPVGYMRSRGGRLALDPERAGIITDLFRRIPNESARDLASELQSRGIVTRRYTSQTGAERGGQSFWPRSVVKLLQNPIYAGYFVHRGEWIKAAHEPLVTLEEWQSAQRILAARTPVTHDSVRNFLRGILHDEQGRRMRVAAAGPGRSRASRYYRSEKCGWAVGSIHRRVMVNADRVEELAISALKGFLCDRVKVRQAVLSLGVYSSEVAHLLNRGSLLVDALH